MSTWFWRLFTRLPVRGFFYAALGLLALTVLWWLLPDAARRPVPAAPSAGSETPRPTAPPARARPSGTPAEEPANPFTSDYLQEWTRAAALVNQPPAPAETSAPAEAADAPAGEGATADAETPEAAAPPVQLLYRGFLVGPDGTARALIEELGAAPAAYYGKGATLHGMELVGMDRDAAELRRGDALLRLPTGKPQEVEVPSP